MVKKNEAIMRFAKISSVDLKEIKKPYCKFCHTQISSESFAKDRYRYLHID